MWKQSAILSLAFATSMGMAQTSGSNQNYGINQEAAQKITNGPVVEYKTDHSAMVAWSTKYPGGTYIAYGTDQNNLSQRTEKAWGGTNHRLEIKNLQPSATYYFQVRSENASGKGAMGADVQSNVETFQTLAKGQAPDKTNYNLGVNGGSGMPNSGMPATASNGQFEPLYRMTGGSDHFYTTDASEHSRLASQGSYRDEGVTGYLAKNQISGSVPVYRLSRSIGTSGDHFYTANPAERQAAEQQGYKDEGQIGFIAQNQLPGTVALYRLLNGNNHFYTADPSEYQRIKQTSGWRDEGVIGYIWNQPQQ
jgi:Repeat of unknown function (DUF5648)/Purple acid Phosphatase, N-terminal domain